MSVRIPVARLELILVTPNFKRMAVSAAKNADNNGYVPHDKLILKILYESNTHTPILIRRNYPNCRMPTLPG